MPSLVPHALLARRVNTVSRVLGRGRGGTSHTAGHTERRGRLGIGARPSGTAKPRRCRVWQSSTLSLSRRWWPSTCTPSPAACATAAAGAAPGTSRRLDGVTRPTSPPRQVAWPPRQAARAGRGGASLSHSVQNGQLFPLREGINWPFCTFCGRWVRVARAAAGRAARKHNPPTNSEGKRRSRPTRKKCSTISSGLVGGFPGSLRVGRARWVSGRIGRQWEPCGRDELAGGSGTARAGRARRTDDRTARIAADDPNAQERGAANRDAPKCDKSSGRKCDRRARRGGRSAR